MAAPLVRRVASLPLRAAAGGVERLVNPRGAPDASALRKAVDGRVVIVTGASYGIGEASARRLAAAGAKVLLVARSRERLEQLAAELDRLPGSAHAHPADLSDPESVSELCAEIEERHGHVDVVVNNAGKSIRRSIARSYERFHDFERTIDINYLGPVRLVLELLPGMRERGDGQIVNVSTIGARLPPAPRWAAYQASKSAFDVFLRSVALEARGSGVAVSTIYLPLVRTRMSAPTPVFRYVPGMRRGEAADLVCKAIVERPREIGPWWLAPSEAGFALARRPWELGLRLGFALSHDAPAARGPAGGPEGTEESGDGGGA